MLNNKNITINNNPENYIKTIFKDKNMKFNYNYISNNTEDTLKLSNIFAKYLNTQDIIVLNGELGTGKTVFVSGIAKYFDIEDQVSSPTFTIVNEYNLKDNRNIYHFDVYRLEDSDDFTDSIGTEYFSNGICIIEWGNIIQDILPNHTIYIDISKDDTDLNKRYFNIRRK